MNAGKNPLRWWLYLTIIWLVISVTQIYIENNTQETNKTWLYCVDAEGYVNLIAIFKLIIILPFLFLYYRCSKYAWYAILIIWQIFFLFDIFNIPLSLIYINSEVNLNSFSNITHFILIFILWVAGMGNIIYLYSKYKLYVSDNENTSMKFPFMNFVRINKEEKDMHIKKRLKSTINYFLFTILFLLILFLVLFLKIKLKSYIPNDLNIMFYLIACILCLAIVINGYNLLASLFSVCLAYFSISVNVTNKKYN